MLAVTGRAPGEEASFSHVTLLGAAGESLRQVNLNSSSSSSYAVEELVGWMDSVPVVPFCVRLTGQDGGGNKLERVSTEMVQPTRVQIQVGTNVDLAGGPSALCFGFMAHRLFWLSDRQ